MLVDGFAELSALEMPVVARAKALLLQLAPQPNDICVVSNGARAALVFVARKSRTIFFEAAEFLLSQE
jgi:hypothetical protein